jgi:hypothetical protein
VLCLQYCKIATSRACRRGTACSAGFLIFKQWCMLLVFLICSSFLHAIILLQALVLIAFGQTGAEAGDLSQVGATGEVGSIIWQGHFKCMGGGRHSERMAHGAWRMPATMSVLEGRLSFSVQGACQQGLYSSNGHFSFADTFLSAFRRWMCLVGCPLKRPS